RRWVVWCRVSAGGPRLAGGRWGAWGSFPAPLGCGVWGVDGGYGPLARSVSPGLAFPHVGEGLPKMQQADGGLQGEVSALWGLVDRNISPGEAGWDASTGAGSRGARTHFDSSAKQLH